MSLPAGWPGLVILCLCTILRTQGTKSFAPAPRPEHQRPDALIAYVPLLVPILPIRITMLCISMSSFCLEVVYTQPMYMTYASHLPHDTLAEVSGLCQFLFMQILCKTSSTPTFFHFLGVACGSYCWEVGNSLAGRAGKGPDRTTKRRSMQKECQMIIITHKL